MAKVVGAPPRPQALFVGFDDLNEVGAMADLVATARVVKDWVDLGSVRLKEWDIAVLRAITGWANKLPGWMHVFAYGGSSTGYLKRAHSNNAWSFTYDGSQPSAMLHVQVDAPEVSETFRRLVQRELVPWLNAQEARPFLTTGSGGGRLVGQTYVADADQHAIAGHYLRAATEIDEYDARCLVVPFTPARPELWLAAAIDEWKAQG